MTSHETHDNPRAAFRGCVIGVVGTFLVFWLPLFLIWFLWSSHAGAFVGSTSTATLNPPTTGTFAYATFQPGAGGFPALGASYTEPIFGTTVTRLSAVYPGTGTGILYGIRGFFNSTSTLYIQNNGAAFQLINAATGAVVVASIPYPFTTTDAISFDPVDPDAFYYTNGTSLMKYTVSTTTSSTLKTFTQTLGGVGQSADWISANGRFFLLNLGGYLRIWDKTLDLLYDGYASTVGVPPGWATISPDGNYVIIAGNPEHWSHKISHTQRHLSCTGIMFWDAAYDHGSVQTATDGKTYLITDGYIHEPNWVYRVDVTLNQAGRGAAQITDAVALFARGFHQAGHFACAGRGLHQDWCFMSTEVVDDQIGSPGTWVPYKQEIIAVQMVTPYEVRRLAHHRSRPVDGDHYCGTPRVNTNWEGTKIFFVSSMGSSVTPSCGYGDVYSIDVSTP